MATLGTFSAGQVLTAAELNAIGTWTTWTPTVTASTGTITSGTLNTANYTQLNELVIARFDYTITIVGTATGSYLQFTLPVQMSAAYVTGQMIGVGRESGATGYTLNALVIDGSANRVRVDEYDGTGWLSSARRATIVCWYEAD